MWELEKQKVKGWVEAGSGLSEWASTSSKSSLSSGLRCCRGHVRRAMLTVRTLMSLLYTSPRRKKREGFHDSQEQELLCFFAPLGSAQDFLRQEEQD